MCVGQTAARIGKRLKDAFELAIDRQPSVVLLDDLHNAMPHFSDGEDQTSAEAILSTRNTHGTYIHTIIICNTPGFISAYCFRGDQ